MNIYFDKEEDDKLDRLKIRFKIKSKEDVVKRLLKTFPEHKDELNDDFDIEAETNMEDLL